jgi:Holliday junction resolvasome RuvABC endonuclease subunit
MMKPAEPQQCETILAIDPGTITGFALRLPDGRLVSGTWNLRGGRFEGGGMRFLRLEDHLKEVHHLTPLGRVYFEEVRRHLGTDAAHVYGGIVATVTAFCEREKIPYQGIPVATIKKTATGKGNSDKAAMVAAAKAKWPDQNTVDDNQADALWLLETACGSHE